MSIDEFWRLPCLNGLFKEPIIGPLKSKMVEIRHLENWHDFIFFCYGWSDLDKISQTGAECHVDCGDMVEIETRSRIPIWRTFGRIQWYVMPEPPACLATLCHFICDIINKSSELLPLMMLSESDWFWRVSSVHFVKKQPASFQRVGGILGRGQQSNLFPTIATGSGWAL